MVQQLNQAGHLLQQDAADAEREPDAGDESPVDRRGKKLLPEPESMSPFVESDADEDHEGTDDGQCQRQRNALGVERQPRSRVEPGGPAQEHVEREVEIEFDDVVRREWRVADGDLMPGVVLFHEVAAAQ